MADKPKTGIWNRYKEGTKRKDCPKCGQGYAMAQHKERSTCGNCGYTEFQKKEKKE